VSGFASLKFGGDSGPAKVFFAKWDSPNTGMNRSAYTRGGIYAFTHHIAEFGISNSGCA